MRRINRTLEQKQGILQELAAWKEQGGGEKGLALQKDMDKDHLMNLFFHPCRNLPISF